MGKQYTDKAYITRLKRYVRNRVKRVSELRTLLREAVEEIESLSAMNCGQPPCGTCIECRANIALAKGKEPWARSALTETETKPESKSKKESSQQS